MSGSDRLYHGIDHVALLFERHLAIAPEAGFDGAVETRLLACAVAFHDCIYDAGRSDNEERSAQFWLEASVDLEAGEREWVAETIRATRDHLSYGGGPGRPEALRLWMLDLDLSPFGEPPDLFDHNALLLRAEASQMDDTAFDTARRRLLRRFVEAPAIYRTPAIAARFEAQARENIARHLAAKPM